MSNAQFQSLLNAIQDIATSLGSRIGWLERIVFGGIGAVGGITLLHTLGVITITGGVS